MNLKRLKPYIYVIYIIIQYIRNILKDSVIFTIEKHFSLPKLNSD